MTNPESAPSSDTPTGLPTGSHARETALREILQVISVSRGDELPVFEAILDAAARLCDVPLAFVSRVNEAGTHLHIPVQRGARADMQKVFAEVVHSVEDSGIVSAHAVRNRSIVHVADMSTDTRFGSEDSRRAELINVEGVRSYLVVPMLRGDTCFGTINLYRRQIVPFQDDEIALVEAFAEQAVIAIENARQFHELQTRLEREQASKDILDVISRSRDDEAPVFNIILENAARLCHAPHAFLMLRNEADTHLEFVAESFAKVSSIVDLEDHSYALDDENSLTIQSLKAAQVRHVPDLREQDASYSTPMMAVAIEKEGMRTLLYVPLLKDGRALGLIGVYKHEVAPFNDGEIEMVQTFAAQAVIAIENVRQFRELQTRLEREQASKDILDVISRSREDETPVFDAILGRAARLCQAQAAGLQLVNEVGSHVRLMRNWGDNRGVIEPGWEMEMDPTYPIPLAIRDGRVLSIDDLKDTDLYRQGDAGRRKLVDQEGVRSWLIVPLLRQGVGVGSMTLSRHEVKPFSDDEIVLVETFAAQAVIAIHNVHQFREVQTRLEREEASRAILQVISASQTDPGPVFDVILRNATRLSGAPLANLVLLNDARSHWQLAAHHGDGLRHLTIGQTTAMDSNLVPSSAMSTGEVVQIEDLTDTDLYRQGDPGRVAMVDVEGMRTIVGVPLIRGHEAIGCITLFRREVKAFTGDEIALVETFAAQAVIAIENVRQFREVQERLEREEAMSEILSVISRSRDDETPVFAAITRKSCELCNADTSALMLGRPDQSELRMAQYHFGEGATTPQGYKEMETIRNNVMVMDPNVHISAEAICTGQVVHIEDLSKHASYKKGDPSFKTMVDVQNERSAISVPLTDDLGTMGAINLYRQRIERFSEDEIELVRVFAAQAVIAIENVRQFREVQTRLEREEATSDVLKVISQSRDDEMPVFKMIQEHAARLCNAPFSGLFMVDKAGENLNLLLHVGSETNYVDGGGKSVWPLSGISAMARAVVRQKVINIDKLSETNAYRDGDSQTKRAVDLEKISSFLAVPLLSDGRAIGCIGLYQTEPVTFTDDQVEMVKTFAAQAVIAIQNVKQFKALEQLNAELGDRVDEQVGELERMGRLKRFLSPQVADAVVSSGADNLLGSHRALIAILFCDIRGFTAFCESAEPEETIEVLQTFHETLGKLIHKAGAGFDHRAGDGIMVVFNDPVPCEDPAAAALRVAIAMRERMVELCAKWRKLGHRMGFGVGISLGYATVGMVGFEGRYDYTASGSAVNLASRLCDQAEDQEILLSQRAATALEDVAEVESAGELTLKGFHAPVDVCRVIGLKETI